jgi:hypothetical protein
MLELAPEVKQYMTYDEALLYCQFLDHNDHKDWRIPTKAEHDEYGIKACWHTERTDSFPTWNVCPVRDVC